MSLLWSLLAFVANPRKELAYFRLDRRIGRPR